MPAHYTKNSLDRLARQAAREYRENHNTKTEYPAATAKVLFWELLISENVCFRVHLTNNDFINVGI